MNEIKRTKQWFEQAVPTPTDANCLVQIGCHLEETAEMLDALGLDSAAQNLHDLADKFKRREYELGSLNIDRKELLDSLCDQLVTAIGVAHMFELDAITGLERVNTSNWSKFVDGKPVFDANGKITKSANYRKPDLTGLY